MLRILYDDFDQKVGNIHDEMDLHHSYKKKVKKALKKKSRKKSKSQKNLVRLFSKCFTSCSLYIKKTYSEYTDVVRDKYFTFYGMNRDCEISKLEKFFDNGKGKGIIRKVC